MLCATGWTFPVLRDSSMELARTSGQQEGQRPSVPQGAVGCRPGLSAVQQREMGEERERMGGEKREGTGFLIWKWRGKGAHSMRLRLQEQGAKWTKSVRSYLPCVTLSVLCAPASPSQLHRGCLQTLAPIPHKCHFFIVVVLSLRQDPPG